MKKEFIEGGKFVGTHGIRGTLRIQPWCDSPDFLCSFKQIYIEQNHAMTLLKIKQIRPHGNVVLADLSGVDTIEAAEALRGQVLYLPRAAFCLEEGQYLIGELVGCAVFHAATGEELGVISDVSKTGANDVWHINRAGTEYLIPAIPNVVQDVDIESGRVSITPLAGIFD